jgi:hypothetical protein
MSDKQFIQILEQLPLGSKIRKVYNAFEVDELRIAVLLPDSKYETRYIAHFEGDEVRLEHRP